MFRLIPYWKRLRIYFPQRLRHTDSVVSVQEEQALPRKARIVIPGVAHHVIQRGHNREVVFAIEEDVQCYLANLVELKNAFGVKLYAYCLMTNHVLLLLVPVRPTGLALLLKHLAARQTRYVNTIERRTSTLWEGRYKSSPVETETYLLACSRYIELNPVRAGIVPSPEAYRWSSYRGKIGLWQDPGTDLDPCYEALGATEQMRRNRYREFVGVGVLPSEQTLIREALQRGQLTGTQRFADEIERKLSIRVEHRARGRPRRSQK